MQPPTTRTRTCAFPPHSETIGGWLHVAVPAAARPRRPGVAERALQLGDHGGDESRRRVELPVADARLHRRGQVPTAESAGCIARVRQRRNTEARKHRNPDIWRDIRCTNTR